MHSAIKFEIEGKKIIRKTKNVLLLIGILLNIFKPQLRNLLIQKVFKKFERNHIKNSSTKNKRLGLISVSCG